MTISERVVELEDQVKPESKPNFPKENCPFCISWDGTKLYNVYTYYFDPTSKPILKYVIYERCAHPVDCSYAIAIDILKQYFRLRGINSCDHDDPEVFNSLLLADKIKDVMIAHKHKTLMKNDPNFVLVRATPEQINYNPKFVIETLANPLLRKDAFERELRDHYDMYYGPHPITTIDEGDIKRLHEDEMFTDFCLSMLAIVGDDFISKLNPNDYDFQKRSV